MTSKQRLLYVPLEGEHVHPDWFTYMRFRLTFLLLRSWENPDRGERGVSAWQANECDRVRWVWAGIPSVFL